MMPKIELTRPELEALIDSVMVSRANVDPGFAGGDPEYGLMLAMLHLKLEEALELWINGGLVEMPIPPRLQGLGIASIHIDHPPHDEGVTKGD